MDAEIVTDAQRGTLEMDTIDAFWSLPSTRIISHLDSELLQTDQTRKILESRDRLIKTYSGKNRLNKILNGLMSNAILVEEATRNLTVGDSFSASLLTKAMLSSVYLPRIDQAFTELQSDSRETIEILKSYRHIFSRSGWNEGTRVDMLDILASQNPESHEDKIYWISKLLAISRKNLFGDGKTFPRDSIPTSETWPSGILTYTGMGSSKGSQVGQEKLQQSISKIKRTMSSKVNTQIMEITKIFMSYIEVPGLAHISYPHQVESVLRRIRIHLLLIWAQESRHLKTLARR